MTVTVQVRNTGPALFAKLKAKAPAAIARSLNRAAVSARTAMIKPIAEDLRLTQTVVKSYIRTIDATTSRQVARLAASLKRLPLILFNAKASKRGGVTARTATGRYPNAFIATMRSGHTGVFVRKLPTRSRKGMPRSSPALPIRELREPSVGFIFIKYRPLGIAAAEASFAKNFQSEMRFALRGA